MQPLDDRTTCYTLIFWYFETADPTRPAGRPDPCTTLNCGRQDHVTSLLRDNLHWLRVRERILFKLCLMVYRALSGLAPSYITELCVPVASIRPRSSLRSVAHYLSRAHVWNSASARSPSQPQLLGTVSLAMSGARQHLTNLNSA